MNKKVDINSLCIGGVSMQDYPDFCDSYIESGCYVDGSAISEEEIEELNCNSPEIAQSAAFQSLTD